MPKFFTKAGWLTPYALACGYIHRTEKSRDETVVLESLNTDFPMYGVTHYLHGATGNSSNYGAPLRDGLKAYATFERIADARLFYENAVGTLQKRYESNSEVQRNVIV